MGNMKKIMAAFLALLIASSVAADAGGRKGSTRYGGVNSHGKWSHYR